MLGIRGRLELLPLESCATGTPILTTTVQDYLEWKDRIVGYVTKPETLELARAMYKVLSDEKMHKTLSRRCEKLVKDCFSSDKVAKDSNTFTSR